MGKSDKGVMNIPKGPIEIDLKDIRLPRQLLYLVRNIYNDPQTNKHTRDLIRFELQRVLGRSFDIKGFLNNKD